SLLLCFAPGPCESRPRHQPAEPGPCTTFRRNQKHANRPKYLSHGRRRRRGSSISLPAGN
ncbi:unnamed protein product, partial [Musa textilis]